ncbi:Storkhead-box protein 1 [Pteropus alecto]|uniref:Storkhead-box protein 1 n=1 Tax=Pteropus alecto TaxID=9402 RepID=L5KBB1_PTEAL|nr:Storkhead-box protein 1 [Pteropus alecto]
MPLKMEKFLQIAPHSLAIILGPAEGSAGEKSRAAQPAPPTQARQLARHHIGYEIFADFKAENMQHFWNKKVTAAVAETFFLGWIDEQVLLIQGKEEHLEVLREGWTRRALRPPSGFYIRCLGCFLLWTSPAVLSHLSAEAAGKTTPESGQYLLLLLHRFSFSAP